jgi:predicted kinase
MEIEPESATARKCSGQVRSPGTSAEQNAQGHVPVNAKSTVYVLCGFIGAGKTTFAKRLEDRTGAVRITKDEWLIQLIGNDPTIDGYAEWDRRICGLSRDFAFQLAGKGIDVIIDEGVWEREQRDIMRSRIEEVGAQAIFYFVDTPIETIRQRVAHRNRNPTKDSFKIGDDLLNEYLKYWQPPGKDEEYVLTSEIEWNS